MKKQPFSQFVIAAALFGKAPARVLGTVVVTQIEGFTMKADSGNSLSVRSRRETRVQRVAPGEPDLA
jgi:hypothetical protein